MLRTFASRPTLQLDPVCVSCTALNHDPDIIAFTAFWKIVLHPSQCGLGNVLLATRRHVARMADLTAEEAADFHSILARLEPALESAFGAPLINMAYQRNWAFRAHQPDPPLLDGRPNPHVHWHITPRYDRPIVFAGVTFDDPTFGEPYEWRGKPVPTTVRVAIIDRIRAQLNIDLVAVEEI